MDAKRRLKNIDVLYISLVDKGANMKKIVFKSDDLPEEPSIIKTVEILKTDVDKRMVYGIVYSPEETDSQGDITDETEIEKAAHGFMKNRRLGKIDKNHNMQPEEGFVVESWITRENDALFKDDSPEGSWAVGIKIDNDDTWEEVKKGEISGLSLMGSAAVEDLSKSESSNIWNLIKQKLGLDDVEKAGRKISSTNAKKIQDAIGVLTQLLEQNNLQKTEVNDMEKADVEKLVDDRLSDAVKKAVDEGFESLKKDLNAKFDTQMTELKDTVAKHETALKKSNGSHQQSGQEIDPDEKIELEKKGQYKDENGKIRTHVFA